jgi:eukaryotic-like serine/threonine-protein kinase
VALNVGDIIQEKYRIVRLIGEGGMGAVYEGENVLISRRVAIKVLHGSAAVNPDIVQRFQREAQAAGKIGNDHILEIIDLGKLADGDLFMVMEYLDGQNLADRIDQSGRLTPQQVYPLLRQLLEGLGAAHGAGIIHRDLKPENVFILKEKAGNKDFVKIIDFGISKFNAMDGSNMGMTATGAVMGTPYYMAPEVAKGVKGADLRSDIYAIGVIMYKAITGDEPFSAETFNELMFKIVLSDLVPARQLVPDLDPAFDSIISKAMAKDVVHRFASCHDMIQALDAWARTGKSVTIPPPLNADPKVLAGLAPSPAPVPAGTPQPYYPGQSSPGAPAFRQSDANLAVPGPYGQQAPGPQTPGVWANRSDYTVPKKSYGPLIAVAGGIAMLVLAVGSFGVYKVVSRKTTAEPSATVAAEAQVPSPAASVPATTPVVQPVASADQGTDAGAPVEAKTDPRSRTPVKPAPGVAPAPVGPRPPRPATPGAAPDFGY